MKSQVELRLRDVRLLLASEGDCGIPTVVSLAWCLTRALPPAAAGLARNVLLDLYALASGLGIDVISVRKGVPAPRGCSVDVGEGSVWVRCPACVAHCVIL